MLNGPLSDICLSAACLSIVLGGGVVLNKEIRGFDFLV